MLKTVAVALALTGCVLASAGSARADEFDKAAVGSIGLALGVMFLRRRVTAPARQRRH
jgi:hypothetical protein